LTYGEPVERAVCLTVLGWGKLNEFSNYLEEKVGTGLEKRVTSPTFVFHGNNPITKATIIHIKFIDLVCISNCSF
jgi:hypothetical protein